MKHASRFVNMAIEVCADSIEELRKCDVFRALETAERQGRSHFLDLVEFIASHRPDLVSTVCKYGKEESNG